jgi:hypothetical protein
MSKKQEIIRLVNNGEYAKSISQKLCVHVAYIYRIAREFQLNIATPPPWNKGLTEQTNESIRSYADKTRERMNTTFERIRRADQNKSMWSAGRFKADCKQLSDARQSWVKKVKSASVEDRRNMLAVFVAAGNAKQNEIRQQHSLDIQWFQHTYPFAKDPELVCCGECGEQFIQTASRRYASGLIFCSSSCWLSYRKRLVHPNYVIDPALAARVQQTKCKSCGAPFLSVCSKWSRKFCSKECWRRWLENHPNFTIKHKYFSEYFGQCYPYDSSYELDFIVWCERFKPISLLRNRPIIPWQGHRYFCDFLIDGCRMVEIKASNPQIYDEKREIAKIKAGVEYAACHNSSYKLITEKELYCNKSINDQRLVNIVESSNNFIGGLWAQMV